MTNETLLQNLRGWLQSFRSNDDAWESIASLSDDELLNALNLPFLPTRQEAYSKLFRLHSDESTRLALQIYSRMF
mgnify:CR=1 FL=1